MDANPNKVIVAKIVQPSFASGIKVLETWAHNHSDEEVVAITKKLQYLYDRRKLENTRGKLVNESVEYTFIDAAAANEYLEFIGPFNPVSAHVV